MTHPLMLFTRITDVDQEGPRPLGAQSEAGQDPLPELIYSWVPHHSLGCPGLTCCLVTEGAELLHVSTPELVSAPLPATTHQQSQAVILGLGH